MMINHLTVFIIFSFQSILLCKFLIQSFKRNVPMFFSYYSEKSNQVSCFIFWYLQCDLNMNSFQTIIFFLSTFNYKKEKIQLKKLHLILL